MSVHSTGKKKILCARAQVSEKDESIYVDGEEEEEEEKDGKSCKKMLVKVEQWLFFFCLFLRMECSFSIKYMPDQVSHKLNGRSCNFFFHSLAQVEKRRRNVTIYNSPLAALARPP